MAATPAEEKFTVKVDYRGPVPLVTVSSHGRLVLCDFPVHTIGEAARLGAKLTSGRLARAPVATAPYERQSDDR